VLSFIIQPWLQKVSMWMPTLWAVDGLDAMTWRGLPLQDALLPAGYPFHVGRSLPATHSMAALGQ
jgi:hypothetical protein